MVGMEDFKDHYFMSKSPISRLKLAVYLRDDFRCRYCGGDTKPNLIKWLLREGRRLEPNGSKILTPTVDHIIPRSKGGLWTYDNLVTACQNCNNKKGSNVLKLNNEENSS